MKRPMFWLVFCLLLLPGCAAILEGAQWLGLSTPEGEPTDTARQISGLIYALTGVSITRIWDGLMTKRGIQNTKNAINPRSNADFMSRLSSIAAILLGFHSPESVKQATPPRQDVPKE